MVRGVASTSGPRAGRVRPCLRYGALGWRAFTASGSERLRRRASWRSGSGLESAGTISRPIRFARPRPQRSRFTSQALCRATPYNAHQCVFSRIQGRLEPPAIIVNPWLPDPECLLTSTSRGVWRPRSCRRPSDRYALCRAPVGVRSLSPCVWLRSSSQALQMIGWSCGGGAAEVGQSVDPTASWSHRSEGGGSSPPLWQTFRLVSAPPRPCPRERRTDSGSRAAAA